MNSFEIYNLLKQCRPLTMEEITKIDGSNSEEVKEGLVEWLLVLNRVDYYQNEQDKLKEIIGQVVENELSRL